MAQLQQLLAELRRRRLFRTVGIYVVTAWVAVQVASLVFPAIEIPDTALRYVWIAFLLLFPLVLVFAWFYDFTSEGLVRTVPASSDQEFDLALRRSDLAILGLLVLVGFAITWQATTDIRDSATSSVRGSIGSEIDPNSIAVLPLENLSGDPEQQYFVSGMQDALIASLSRIGALKVTSRTSTQQFQETLLTIPDIAAQLGVARLIEGSVYKIDDRVRINVQLIDAATDRHIWVQDFENDIQDVLQLQNEIAQAIAEQVEVTLSPMEAAQLQRTRTIDPAAYDALLNGQFYVERFTPQDMALAEQYYQQAVDLNPDYAPAHFGLAKLCVFRAQSGVITPDEARATCKSYAQKALELDNSLAEADANLAGILVWQDYNWAEAEISFRRAIEISPSYAEARAFYSHYLTLIGRTNEGNEQMRIALDLDPLNLFTKGLYGAQLMMIGDFDNAIRVIEEVFAASPGSGFGHIILWHSYFTLGDYDAAIRAAANHFRVTRGDPTGALALEAAYVNGDYRAAVLHAAEVLAEHSKTTHVPSLDIGSLYDQAGEIEKAIDWMETAFSEHDPDGPYMGVFAFTQAVKSHPRFISLLREMKLDYWADFYSQ